MTEMNQVVAYVAQPTIDDALDGRVAAGTNFSPEAMCHYCRRMASDEEPHASEDNVVAMFSTCRQSNGCLVCAFCGLAMLDSFLEHGVVGAGKRDCPECGAVGFIAASRFVETEDERVAACREALVDWRRRTRCLELLGAVAGIAVADARERGDRLDEVDVERFLDASFAILQMSPSDESVNQFFDSLRDARTAVRSPILHAQPKLSIVPN